MHDPLADLAGLEGVPSAVAAALDSVDAVLRDRGLRRVRPEVLAASLLRGARANAELTGEGARWLPGAVRLSTELTALAGLVRVAPAQVLARAHTLVARGVVRDEELGRIGGGGDLDVRMEALTHLLRSPTQASVVVLASVVHAELATARPFGSGDEVVARGVAHMVLVSGGVDPAGLVPVEAGHAETPAEYRAALAGYVAGSAAGVRGWLLHCTAALGRGAELLELTG